jgi:ribulose-bisphosphate carboxylase large chain
MKGNYLALGEEVDPEGYVICIYKTVTKNPLDRVANAIAAEETTGTWTDVSTFTDDIFERLGGKVIKLQPFKKAKKGSAVPKGGTITIAYPIEDFSPDVGGVPQLLSIVAGNLFGLSNVDKVRLETMSLPMRYVAHFKGPRFGIQGMREILDRKPGMPFLGTIIKPKIGLKPEAFAKYVYEAGMGGLTNSKDDETLVDQTFCPLVNRVMEVADAIDKVKSETGHRMVHAVNISTRVDKIVELAHKAQDLGANQIMVDYLTCGITALQALSENPSIKIPIHVHRAMHGAITRDPMHGVSMPVLALLARLCGADSLHIGTFGVGKMEGSEEDSGLSKKAITEELTGLKPCVPVSSGGMYPGIIPPLIKAAGPDIQIQAGGGVSGHPGGVRAGALAMVQATEAAVKGVALKQYAKTHKELKQALDKWGEINAKVFSY